MSDTTEDKTLVAAGKLFCFSEGAYSDYGYVGHFLALKPITKALFETIKERCMVRIRAGEGESYGGPPDLDDANDINRAMRGLFLPELIRSGANRVRRDTSWQLWGAGDLRVPERRKPIERPPKEPSQTPRPQSIRMLPWSQDTNSLSPAIHF